MVSISMELMMVEGGGGIRVDSGTRRIGERVVGVICYVLFTILNNRAISVMFFPSY
jgi:hypothetical protein